MSYNIWEEKNNPELVHNHMWNIAQKLIGSLKDHYDGVDVFYYSHSGVLELGGEEQPQAPCIILTGPEMSYSTHLTTGKITVDVGTDDIGHVRTREYNAIKYYDLEYTVTFVMSDMFQLLATLESNVHFFTERGYIRVDGNVYKVVITDNLSTDNIRNYTNSPMAVGRFVIKGVMFVDPYRVLHSGRVYYPKYQINSKQEDSE